MSIAQETQNKLADLQNRYIAALGNKDMAAWAATFSKADDASYICRSAENEANGWPMALMMDDCRNRIDDRILFVTQVWAGTFQDYRTRHFLQRVSCEQVDENTFKLRSNFSIEYTMDPHESKTLATGVYEDVVVLEDGEARFKSRLALYDTTVLPTYIVYPF